MLLADDSMERNHSYEASFMCDSGDFHDPTSGNWDNVHDESDVEDLSNSNMVAQPRKVWLASYYVPFTVICIFLISVLQHIIIRLENML